MHFLIRRCVRIDKRTGHKEYQELRVRTQRLTIGRAPDQHLQIAERSVELHHAIISLRRRGQLYINALTASGFQINGESRKTAALSPGDSIQIGTTVITVEQPQMDQLAVVTIEYGTCADADNLESLHHTALSQTRLSKRSLSWVFAFSVMTLFLLIPISGVVYPPLREILRENTLIPDDNLWSTGPLHPAHQIIGKDCNSCHTTPFKMVRNRQCLECHTDIQHHVDVTSQDVQVFEQNRCASCHREHNEPSILVQQDQRFCADCHRQLDKQKTDTELANVSDFGADHPEFRLTLLMPHHEEEKTRWEPTRLERNSLKTIREKSFLQFSHKDHLDPKGLKSPDGDKVLLCQDCHRPNTSERQMLPITMENHCSDCHSLLFDENDLNKQIPHGDLNALYETLKEHFSRQYLDPASLATTLIPSVQHRRPGGENRILSLEERQRALDWTDKQSLMIAQELLEDRLCGDCHQISRVPGKTGFEQWHLEPVALTKQWMPLARFDHASHDVEACTSCHENAQKSEKSSDVLMPKIEICRECHSGATDKVKLPSDCLMCHQFHLTKRGLLDQVQRTEAEKSLAGEEVSGRLKTEKGSH